METFTPRRDGFFLSLVGSFAADKVWWGRKRGGLRAGPLYIRGFFFDRCHRTEQPAIFISISNFFAAYLLFFCLFFFLPLSFHSCITMIPNHGVRGTLFFSSRLVPLVLRGKKGRQGRVGNFPFFSLKKKKKRLKGPSHLTYNCSSSLVSTFLRSLSRSCS